MLCPPREKDIRFRDSNLGQKEMKRWGLHGGVKFLDKDFPDVTGCDSAGTMDYSRAGHLATAWRILRLSVSFDHSTADSEAKGQELGLGGYAPG